MLTEDPNCCSICGCEVHGYTNGIPLYYCHTCFTNWRDQIDGRSKWVMFLMNHERQRRKRRNNRLKKGYVVVEIRPYQEMYQ